MSQKVPLLLGIDIGTSSTKAILTSVSGDVLGYAQQTYGIDTPYQGWAEQNPETWLDAVVKTTYKLLRRHHISPDQVIAIGLSGQMHGTVCVSDKGLPLRPAIIWADQRSVEQLNFVYKEIGKTNLAKWTANPLATGFMLLSWLWLCQNEPEITRQIQWLLLPKDYVRLRMTGIAGSEPSDASSTSLFDTAQRKWSLCLLDALNLDPVVLPPLHPSASIAGGLLPEIAGRMGLQTGTPVIYGGSDQAMQALGNGVIEAGVISSTIGTGGQLFAPTSSCVVDHELRMHSFCHIMPVGWHVETAILSAGFSLKWLRDNVLSGSSFQQLADAAKTASPGSEGVFFLPYLMGERTPHMDPRARGGLIGLTKYHNRTHIIRAVMEGVVFAMRQGLELLTDLHVVVDKVVASGGAIVHPLWVQLQADIYNCPVTVSETTEAAAFGAAILAGVGVGVYPDVRNAVERAVKVGSHVVYPNPEYPALSPISDALANYVTKKEVLG